MSVSVNFIIHNASLDDLFLDSSVSEYMEFDHAGGEECYSLPDSKYERFVDWAYDNGYHEGKDFWEVDRNGNPYMGESTKHNNKRNKMKLTEAEKLKVKKFAKKLVEKKGLKEGKYHRLPKKIIGNDLYVFQKRINSECESVMHGNDFDVDQWKSMLEDMQKIIKSAKEFDSEKDPIPVNF